MAEPARRPVSTRGRYLRKRKKTRERLLDAAKQVAVAKFWCAEGAKRVVHAATHLHGGVGVDKEYPLHRYFLHARHLELALGGGTPQLLKLGKLLAAE